MSSPIKYVQDPATRAALEQMQAELLSLNLALGRLIEGFGMAAQNTEKIADLLQLHAERLALHGATIDVLAETVVKGEMAGKPLQ